jgi:hypothetical protein
VIIEFPKFKDAEIDQISSDMELDLVAFFKLLEEDVLKVLDDNKDKNPDVIINEISKLLV